jgi:hypothetical protein
VAVQYASVPVQQQALSFAAPPPVVQAASAPVVSMMAVPVMQAAQPPPVTTFALMSPGCQSPSSASAASAAGASEQDLRGALAVLTRVHSALEAQAAAASLEEKARAAAAQRANGNDELLRKLEALEKRLQALDRTPNR